MPQAQTFRPLWMKIEELVELWYSVTRQLSPNSMFPRKSLWQSAHCSKPRTKCVFPKWSVAELMSVFHHQLRDKKWTRDKFLTTVRQFNNDDIGGFWTWLPLDSEIIEAAANSYTTLPENVWLRTVDSIHVITAMHHGFSKIYTYDGKQSAVTALRSFGVKTSPIG